MPSMNVLFASAAVTLLAGAVPLVAMSSPSGALVSMIAILIAIVGSGFTLTLYFRQDENRMAVATSSHDQNCYRQSR